MKDPTLLTRIRWYRLSARQKKLIQEYSLRNHLPLYKILREPTHLNEFDWKKYGNFAIWRDNGSILVIAHHDFQPFWKRNVFFTFDDVLYGAIYGETDAAIAETATFFWSLQHETCRDHNTYRLRVDFHCKFESGLNSAFSPEQFVQILDSNPTRSVEFSAGSFNAEQSVVLASRPYPRKLVLDGSGFNFNDMGTAFVDALETRQSSFRTLHLVKRDLKCFSHDNLRRLFQLEHIFERIYCVGDIEDALLPLSARANQLDYRMHTMNVQPSDFDSVDIVAKDLTLKLFLEHRNNQWDALLISFFHRVAELGHFERFCFSISYRDSFPVTFPFDRVAPVVDALIRALHANPMLRCLDLSDTHRCLHWFPHLQRLFQSIEEHPGLRTFFVKGYDPEDDYWYGDVRLSQFQFDFSWLERLLSRNRSIEVLDGLGQRWSNGPVIDKLYSLNKFYIGSESVVKEFTSLRPTLVATALVESASNNVQYTALLLSHHTDVICEFVHSLDYEEMDASQSVSVEASITSRSHM